MSPRRLRAPNEKQGPADRRRRPLRPPRLKGWGADGEAAGLRRVVGADRAVDPEGEAALPLSGAQAARRPQGVDGDPVRVADRDRVGVLAAGAGLRLGDDLLATLTRVATGRCVAAAARVAAGEAERGRPDRLVAGRDRQLARAGVWGGAKTGPSPVDRSRSGAKHDLIACGRGTPLTVGLTGGNRNDITQMIPLVDAIPPVRGRRGRPRRRPRRLFGDRAYHSREGLRELRCRRIQARIAAPKTPHGSGLGKQRWVVERTIAWLHQYRRL